jgi:histidinol-phosphatase
MAQAFGAEWSASLRRGSDAELDSWLAFALAVCDASDAISLPAFLGELDVTEKGDGSFVTEADRGVERLIRERIAHAFPDHGIVGEEYGTEVGSSGCRWYIDPIDGTHNFMRGVPLFGTLLAVERDGELQVGAASAPAMGRRWWASRGGGAWMTEPGADRPRRLHVSGVSTVADMQLVYRSVSDMAASRLARGFERLLGEVWRARAFGDFWGYTLVARGAAEVMCETDLHPWDLAAPWVIVEEAGGRITDFDGRRDWLQPEGYATNGLLHDEVLARLRA